MYGEPTVLRQEVEPILLLWSWAVTRAGHEWLRSLALRDCVGVGVDCVGVQVAIHI